MEVRYGLWVTTEARRKHLLCRCDCGTVRLVAARNLRIGRSKSCGCTRPVKVRKAPTRPHRTHGMYGSTEYQIWTDMRRRCHDPRRPDYFRYGGRGITVCDEWRESFEAFYRDMGNRPAGHTLDRLNNDLGYSKRNCVWATKEKQARNMRSNHIVEVDGARMTLVEAAEKYGINYGTLINRVCTMKWEAERALKTPVRILSNNRPPKPRSPHP